VLINQLSSTQPNTSTYSRELSSSANAKTNALTQQNKNDSSAQTTNSFTNSQKAKVATSEIINANNSMSFLHNALRSLQKLQSTIETNSYNGKEMFPNAYKETSDTLNQTLKTKHQNQPIFNGKQTNSALQYSLSLSSAAINTPSTMRSLEHQTKQLQEKISQSIQSIRGNLNLSIEQLQINQSIKSNEQEQNTPSVYPDNNTYHENFASIARQKELNWLLR